MTMSVPRKVISWKTDDETERMLKELEQRFSFLYFEGHGQFLRFLIRRLWFAEFQPEKLEEWEAQLEQFLNATRQVRKGTASTSRRISV
jgi:hypothetical protein